MNSTTVTPNDMATTAQSALTPVIAHREKSITHVIGFSPVSHTRFDGTDVVGYATGVTNNQIWIRNGTTYCTSLYATLRADSHTLTLNAAKIALSITSGSSRAVKGGTN